MVYCGSAIQSAPLCLHYGGVKGGRDRMVSRNMAESWKGLTGNSEGMHSPSTLY